MLITEDRLQSALKRSEHRLGMARNRRQKQRRLVMVAGAGVVLLLLGGVAVSSARRNAPGAPQLVVSWPSPKKFGVSRLPDGATVLIRKGQPLTVSVTQPQSWNVRGLSSDTVANGASIPWAPTSSPATLEVQCSAKADGPQRLAAWFWPVRVLKLRGIVPETLPDGRLSLPAPRSKTGAAWIWVSSQVAAQGPVSWDERALPLLEAAGKDIPYKGYPRADLSKPGVSDVLPPPDAPRWTLVSSFDGKLHFGDDATYAELDGAESMNDEMPTLVASLARAIAEKSPSVSIKVMARPSGPDSQAILRLAFDGKSKRVGWLKKAGQTEGEPFEWWKDSSPAPTPAVS